MNHHGTAVDIIRRDIRATTAIEKSDTSNGLKKCIMLKSNPIARTTQKPKHERKEGNRKLRKTKNVSKHFLRLRRMLTASQRLTWSGRPSKNG